MNSPTKSSETCSIDTLGDLMASLVMGGLPDGVTAEVGVSATGKARLVLEGFELDSLRLLYVEIARLLEMKLESASDSGDPADLGSGLSMFRGKVAKAIGLALSGLGLGMGVGACTGPDGFSPQPHGDSFGNVPTLGTVMSPLTKPELYNLGEGVAPEWGAIVEKYGTNVDTNVFEIPGVTNIVTYNDGLNVYYVFAENAKELQEKAASYKKTMVFPDGLLAPGGKFADVGIYKNVDGITRMRIQISGGSGSGAHLLNIEIDSEAKTLSVIGDSIPIEDAPFPENLTTYDRASFFTAPNGSSHMISVFEEYGPVKDLNFWTGEKEVLGYYNLGSEYDHGDEHISECGAPTISGDVAVTTEISGPFGCALKYRPNWTNVAPEDQPASLIAINGQSDKNLNPRIIPGINGQGGLIYTQQYENEEGELKYRLVVVAVEMPDELNCGDGLCDLVGGENPDNCSEDCEEVEVVVEPAPDVVEPQPDMAQPDTEQPVDVEKPDDEGTLVDGGTTNDEGTTADGGTTLDGETTNDEGKPLDGGKPLDEGKPLQDGVQKDSANPRSDAGNPRTDAAQPDSTKPDAGRTNTADSSIQPPPVGDGGCNSSNAPSKVPWYMVAPMLLLAIRRRLKTAVEGTK